jgi:mRNA interferase RelE/StbE
MNDVIFTAAATRQWMKLPPQTRKRIGTKLDAFAATGLGDIKKLKGQDGARLRVGYYRLILYQESSSIVVVAVGHRRDIYD